MKYNKKDYPTLNGLFGNYEDLDFSGREWKKEFCKDQNIAPKRFTDLKVHTITCPTCDGVGKIINRREKDR
tara:strand:- start:417 stop:629 length:213 start_codon:yes stop_codon:yes gene_type:complete